MRLISRFLCLSLALIFLNSASANGQDYSKQFYSKDDFYFLNKAGKRTLLDIVPGKIAVQFFQFTDNSVHEKVFGEYGLAAKDWERITVNFGASEIKRTVFAQREVFVVSLPASLDSLSFINSLLAQNEVYDAAPVFRLNGESVFPAGIWVNDKFASAQEKNALQSKLITHNYFASWSEYGQQRPPGVSARLNYYRRTGKDFTNPLRLSRLIAQDVLALWSIPDFVPLKPPIEVSWSLSRPSGMMNAKFEAAYRIKYNPKKVVPDIDALKNTELLSLKPKDMAEGFFRPEQLNFQESPGNILIKFSFRMYEPGSFELQPLAVRYNYAGADKEAPPEVASSAALRVKIAGLVPRDSDGKPLAMDIFGWKKMGIIKPEIPPMPKAEDYPPTDIRFYGKGIQLKYPALGTILMSASYLIFVVMALIGSFFLGRLAYRRMLLRKSSVAGEFARTGTARSAKRYIREILRAPDGRADSELLAECPDELRGDLAELLSVFDKFAGDGKLSEFEISKTRYVAHKLRKGMKWK